MKMKLNYIKLALLFAAVVLATSCTKEMSELKLDPEVKTAQSSAIQAHTAQIEGFIVASGAGFSEKGICYSTSPEPSITDSKVEYTGEGNKASFIVTIEGLERLTKYYARAYAVNESGTIYGKELTFTTIADIPYIDVVEVTEVTGNSAKGGGILTDSGGVEIIELGICYGTEENPTVEGTKIVADKDLEDFISELVELAGKTTYYVRAFATNSAGTGYSPQVTFTTEVDLPKIATVAVSEVTKISAKTGGEIIADGGSPITARGIVWGSSENPTLSDNVIADGGEENVFESEVEGLTLFTTYHVRAYATNELGTAYGENIEFKTLADITQLWVVGDYNEWSNNPDAEFIISTPTSEGVAEGYVYLTAGGLKLVTEHSSDDSNTFGDNGSGGLTNGGEDIAVAVDGYYRITANLGDMTYSLVKMDWGVVGDATPGGWDTDTKLTYDPISKTLRGVVHLVEGECKYRANNNWDYNFGITAEELVAGGDNIEIDVEADYAIELNLSVPNEQSGSINRWGVIGDATPGGWDTDTDMVWDAVNEVFTVTLELLGERTFKFRANGSWDTNYGGDIDALIFDSSDNISVAEDGNYTLTFDPWGLVGAMVKN